MKSNIKRKNMVKAVAYKYRLIGKIDPALDLRPFADDIIKIIKGYGGYDVSVYTRGYSFKVPRGLVLTNGMKRKIGRKIAKINGIGCYAYKRNYYYSNGTPAKSAHLFKRSKKVEF